MSSARGRGYSSLLAAGTSPEGLLTDEVDLTKQGEHTQTFIIDFIYINIYFPIYILYNLLADQGWGRGLA